MSNSKAIYLFYDSVSFGHALSQVDGLMSQSVRDVPFYPFGVSLIRDWRHHVVGCLCCCLKCYACIRNDKREGTQTLMFRVSLPGWSAPSCWWAPGRPWLLTCQKRQCPAENHEQSGHLSCTARWGARPNPWIPELNRSIIHETEVSMLIRHLPVGN